MPAKTPPLATPEMMAASKKRGQVIRQNLKSAMPPVTPSPKMNTIGKPNAKQQVMLKKRKKMMSSDGFTYV